MPYEPTPWEQATKTFGWKKEHPHDIPLHLDMALVRADTSADGKLRLDMSKLLGMPFLGLRVQHQVCDIRKYPHALRGANTYDDLLPPRRRRR